MPVVPINGNTDLLQPGVYLHGVGELNDGRMNTNPADDSAGDFDL